MVPELFGLCSGDSALLLVVLSISIPFLGLGAVLNPIINGRKNKGTEIEPCPTK